MASLKNKKVRYIRLTPQLSEYTSYFQQLSEMLLEDSSEANIEDIGSWVNANANIYLAVRGSTVVGYCVIVDDVNWGHGVPAILDVIYLNKKYRGKGHGKGLIKFSIEDYYKSGTKDIVIFVDSTNLTAFNLYTSVGFTEVGSFYHIMGYGDKIHQLVYTR